ncbi:MAG: Wide host range VirA protein [Planctomycetes bacterium ADurb.Bin126]|nr:MAG: Wide host range VirA protein [Planctomycetes bacterium ADurb.Bin126]HOD83656.1 ATP-binding protein [Phycisphaerae bacterium]HQL75779.1 ATP-binding protein [Phycisphaerae bacterium]
MGLTPPWDDFYRVLCDRAAVALAATDEHFNIVFWNQAAQALLGPAADQVLGKPLHSVVPPNRRKLLQRLLHRTVRRNETSQFEVRLTGTDDHARDLMVVLSPIPSRNSQACGIAAWVIDETAQKQMAQRLAQAEKMASLGTLANGVAHHFNNILGGVATFVDFALSSNDLIAMKRALQMTAEAAARASKITQSLLSFANTGRQREDMADLTEILLTFVHLVERPLGQRRIHVQLDLKAIPVLPVEANRMHQVLGNLLANAEEAMPDGGTIDISIARQDNEIVVGFADTGCGIEAKYLPMVFEPFFTTKGLLAGGDKANPGLGLSIVHGLVRELGGRITVLSECGHGTRFNIFFPLPADEGGL